MNKYRKAIDATMSMLDETLAARLIDEARLTCPGTGIKHIREMHGKILADPSMSDTKLCRWLGWMQASITSWKIGLELENMKELNVEHISGGPEGSDRSTAIEPTRDYRELLKKYLQHVQGCEGITFVDYNSMGGKHLTEEDVAELERLEDEIWPSNKSGAPG